MASLGKSISLSGPPVIRAFSGTLYSITSASVPVIILTCVTLGFMVCLKIRLAVAIFLLMMVSMPEFSARLIYSIFSTSAMVFITPIFLASRQARIFVSELPVTATKASIFRRPSSANRSPFLPSPLMTRVSSSASARSRHLSMSMSISFTWQSYCSFSAICLPIRLPPRIMMLFA